jgi:hypothetical protein
MKNIILTAVVFGLGAASMTTVAGALFGGIMQLAPCYGGAAERSFFEMTLGGAMFGMLWFGFYYAPIAALGGFVVGGLLGSIKGWLRRTDSSHQANKSATKV